MPAGVLPEWLKDWTLRLSAKERLDALLQ